MDDRGAKVFEMAARGGECSGVRDVFPAGLAVDSGQRPIAPILCQRGKAVSSLIRAGVSRRHVLSVDVEHVGYADLRRRTARSAGLVLAGDVVGEDSLSLDKLRLSAACAHLLCAVSDDEKSPLVSPRRSKPESDSFGLTRHRSLIESMAASVVKSLPPILSIASRPLAPSRRKVAAVTPPPGKASSAARARRNGVLGLMAETLMASPYGGC